MCFCLFKAKCRNLKKFQREKCKNNRLRFHPDIFFNRHVFCVSQFVRTFSQLWLRRASRRERMARSLLRNGGPSQTGLRRSHLWQKRAKLAILQNRNHRLHALRVPWPLLPSLTSQCYWSRRLCRLQNKFLPLRPNPRSRATGADLERPGSAPSRVKKLLRGNSWRPSARLKSSIAAKRPLQLKRDQREKVRCPRPRVIPQVCAGGAEEGLQRSLRRKSYSLQGGLHQRGYGFLQLFNEEAPHPNWGTFLTIFLERVEKLGL